MERFQTLRDLKTKTNNQTRILYHMNYWDGPLSGVMLWEGKRMFFNCINEHVVKTLMSPEDLKEVEEYLKEQNQTLEEDDKYDYDTIRVYGVYDLEPEVMEAIEFNHELFQKYVGTHCDYKEDGSRGNGARIPLRPDHPEDIGDLKPYSEHDKFYKGNEQKTYKLELNENNLIARFER